MPGRTCVAVAHRLSTVAGADVIHVLKGGQVVESGSHQHLLQLGGAYASLAAKQALRFGEDAEAQGGDAEADAVVAVEAGARRSKGPARTLRESLLRRGSVRLSIIPQVGGGWASWAQLGGA